MSTTTHPEEETSLPYGFGIALIVGLLVAAFALLPRIFRPHETELAGKEAPDIALSFVANAPAGQASSSLSHYKGKAVILDFWATWCGPCQAQSPILDRIAARYADRGVVVLGVNTSDQPGAAEVWTQRHHISYPIAYDEGQSAAQLYDVTNLPTLVILSREGKIVAIRQGLTDGAEIESILKRVL